MDQLRGTAEELREALREMGLANQAGLARRWGLSRQRVSELVRDPTFPSAAAHLDRAPVWFVSEADRWYRGRDLLRARARVADLIGP